MKVSDTMTPEAILASAQKDVIGAEIITQTLDVLNQKDRKGDGRPGSGGTSADMAASYDFQKSVLSAAYSPKGVVTNITS